MTLAVLIGLFLEYFEISHETREAIARSKDGLDEGNKTAPWKTILAAVGWVLIVLGVAGELVFEASINRKDGDIQIVNAKLLGDTGDEADRASQSAKGAALAAAGAIGSTASVEAQETLLEKRLSAASSKVGTLEDAVAWQGPRWQKLDAAKSEFEEAMKEFAGQKILIDVCEQDPNSFDEKNLLANGLRNSLLSNEVRWTPVNPTSTGWCGQIGVHIFDSTLAPPSVKGAADALNDALIKMHISSQKTDLKPIPADVITDLEKQGIPFFSFWAVHKDPSLIAVQIGEDPGVDIRSSFNKGKKRPHSDP